MAPGQSGGCTVRQGLAGQSNGGTGRDQRSPKIRTVLSRRAPRKAREWDVRPRKARETGSSGGSHRDSDSGCDAAGLAGHVDLPGDEGMVARHVDTEIDAEFAGVFALKLEASDAARAARTFRLTDDAVLAGMITLRARAVGIPKNGFVAQFHGVAMHCSEKFVTIQVGSDSRFRRSRRPRAPWVDADLRRSVFRRVRAKSP
jgi:hypothetical protein